MIIEIRISQRKLDERYAEYQYDYERLFDALNKTAVNNKHKTRALWDEIKYLNRIYGLTMKYIINKLNVFRIGE